MTQIASQRFGQPARSVPLHMPRTEAMARLFVGIALAGYLTTLAACGDEAQPDFSVTVNDSAGIRIVQNVLSDPMG